MSQTAERKIGDSEAVNTNWDLTLESRKSAEHVIHI